MTGPTRAAALSISTVAVFAALVRVLWWQWANGPISGGDSSRYLEFAARVAGGDFSTFRDWPFHQLYSVTLAPMFAWSLPQPAYLQVLHVSVSTLTVVVMAATAWGLLGKANGLVVGAAAALYLPFLLWMPYILTETTFLCAVAFYLWASVRLLNQRTWRTALIWGIAAVVFIAGRPSGPPVAAATALVLGCCLLYQWRGPRVATLAGAAVAAVGLVVVTTALSSPAIRQRILTMPTVTQSLWASTKVSTGNMKESRAFGALDEKVDQMFLGAPLEDKIAYKVADATAFITANPGTYSRMAMSKLVAFWFPWPFTDDWSPAHRLVDAVISLGLTFGLLLALKTTISRQVLLFVVALAGSFAVLSAFSQIDPDGRYRLPAELPVLVVAPAGWCWLLRATAARVMTRAKGEAA